MADNKNSEKKYGAPADSLASDAYPAVGETHDPDAAHYSERPTTAEVNADYGEVPEGRFREQVPTSEAGSGATASHPEENQPLYGVPGDEGDKKNASKGEK